MKMIIAFTMCLSACATQNDAMLSELRQQNDLLKRQVTMLQKERAVQPPAATEAAPAAPAPAPRAVAPTEGRRIVGRTLTAAEPKFYECTMDADRHVDGGIPIWLKNGTQYPIVVQLNGRPAMVSGLPEGPMATLPPGRHCWIHLPYLLVPHTGARMTYHMTAQQHMAPVGFLADSGVLDANRIAEFPAPGGDTAYADLRPDPTGGGYTFSQPLFYP